MSLYWIRLFKIFENAWGKNSVKLIPFVLFLPLILWQKSEQKDVIYLDSEFSSSSNPAAYCKHCDIITINTSDAITPSSGRISCFEKWSLAQSQVSKILFIILNGKELACSSNNSWRTASWLRIEFGLVNCFSLDFNSFSVLLAFNSSWNLYRQLFWPF